jgi:hypothetical protein
MIIEIELFESPDLMPLGFCLWILMKGEIYKRKADTPDEMLASILDAAARVKKRENQVRRSKHDLRSRVAKRAEADGGIFGHLL